MTVATTATRTGPVVFAGRFDVGDPEAVVVTEALPRAIRPLDPSHWVIVDPVAFPYEAMSERHWDAPVSVVLPTDLGVDGLLAVLGAPLLGRLTPFDVVVSPPWLWEAVRPAYALAETQWRPVRGGTAQVVGELVQGTASADELALLLTGDETPAGSRRLMSRWDVRSKRSKARYQSEVEVLRPMLRRAIAAVPPGRSWSAVEFSDDVHGLVSVLGRTFTELVAVRPDPAVAALARLAYPEHEVVGSEGDGAPAVRAEHADVVAGLVEQPDEVMAGLLPAVWAGLRVGGSMLVMLRGEAGAWTLERLTRLVLDVSAGSAVLSDVGGALDPASGRAGSMVFAFTKIGAPRTW